MGELLSRVGLRDALTVIAVMAVLAAVSFSSGYMTASIQYDEQKALRVMYRQALPRLGPF